MSEQEKQEPQPQEEPIRTSQNENVQQEPVELIALTREEGTFLLNTFVNSQIRAAECVIAQRIIMRLQNPVTRQFLPQQEEGKPEQEPNKEG